MTPRGRERRRQLIAYATHRFAESGYHPTSVGEIVTGLGVGKGVFYWYFSSKEELFREILREAQLDLRRSQRRAIEGATTPLERIELGIRSSMEWSIAHPDELTLFQFGASEETFAALIRKGEEIAIADAAKHVKDAIAEGQVPDADPVLLAQAMYGVATRLARTCLEQPAAADQVADLAVAFCRGGVLGHPR